MQSKDRTPDLLVEMLANNLQTLLHIRVFTCLVGYFMNLWFVHPWENLEETHVGMGRISAQ